MPHLHRRIFGQSRSGPFAAQTDPAHLSTRSSRPASIRSAACARARRGRYGIVADGDPENAFVAVLIRMGARQGTRRRAVASQEVLAAWPTREATVSPDAGLSLSVEIQEIEESGRSRKNNPHERLKSNGATRCGGDATPRSSRSDAFVQARRFRCRNDASPRGRDARRRRRRCPDEIAAGASPSTSVRR